MDSVYALSLKLAELEEVLIENGGELTPEIEAALTATEASLSLRSEKIGKWILNISANEDALTTEINRLSARKKTAQALQDRLKEYLKNALITAGKNKLTFDTFTISVVKNPPSVDITDKEAVPAGFLTIIPQTTMPDKKRIADALKNGDDVNGARLIIDKTSLRIK